MDLNTLLTLLLGAGGAGAIGSLVSVVRTLRKGKLDDEETLIKRLDASNKDQVEQRKAAEKRADDAEAEAARYRVTRDKALEYAARLRRQLIDAGHEPIPEPEEFK